MAHLRNGMIGILVFISLLIIFIPHFFLNTPSTGLKSLTIPHRPSPPSPNQLPLGLNLTSQSFKLALSPTHAWLLQVADFKNSSQAILLVQTLRKKGFKAYAHQIMASTGLIMPAEQVTRVFVGPEIKLAQIKTLATRLHREMQLSTTVTAFDPLLL